jgi:DNA-binding response OmpR family regulator
VHPQARILVVEDEALLAFALEEMLGDFGYDVIGPAPTIRAAMKLVACERVDAAVLDVNLGRESIAPVAGALADAGVPFVFTTGYTHVSALPDGFQNRPVLNKPYQPEALRKAIERLLGGSA